LVLPTQKLDSMTGRATPLRVPGRRFLPPDPRVTEPYRLSPQTAFRIGILGALALAAFGVLFLRLWSLQVLSSDRYLEAAQNNQVRTLPLEAPRGSILDRSGHPLVTNKPGTAVRIWVADLPRKRRYQELRQLSRVLGVPLPEILAKIERKKRDPLTPVTIKEDVATDEVMYILERRSQFPGVFVDDTSLRHYPQGVLASQLVGHVGEVTDLQLEDREGVRLGEKIGQSGVEAAFDRYLRGKMGSAQLRVDSLGRPTSDIEQTTPETPGLSVRLTLDIPLQRAAEQALEYGIQQATVVHKNWYANGGAIVALDPRDGAILALASHPEYDPRVYSDRRKPRALRVLTNNDAAEAANFPSLNRALDGVYPPGSTFKPVTALAAMEEGLMHPYYARDCPPSYSVNKEGTNVVDQVFKNWNYPAGGGMMTLNVALAASCDTYFYELGHQFYNLPSDRGQPLQKWARLFGFGQSSGVEVGPENEGLLPTIKWRHETFTKENYPDTWQVERLWKPGDSIQLAIGQKDLLVTPIQMARFYALIANNGKLVTPHLLQQVEQGDPKSPAVLRRSIPPAARDVGVSESALYAVRQGLYEATHESYGTSVGIFGAFEVPVAGKTGTAEKWSEQLRDYIDQSWWCGYGPTDNAELVVCAVIENGGFGAEAAAPAALKVFEKYFETGPTFVREVPSD
jgi:penicillin-binding protein 2